MKNKVLVTGCAGFIGSNLVDRLLELKAKVVGVDNFNNYYDPQIKWKNLEHSLKNRNFKVLGQDILEAKSVEAILNIHRPVAIVHLAARAGVRPSMADPISYAETNVVGTVNLLLAAKKNGVRHFILGSSSSVYGESKDLPFREEDLCENIVSPYGASKRSGEFFAEAFCKTFGMKVTIIRFFSVYGKRGRPDMAPAIFTKNILAGRPITVFGDGSMARDYTNISDIVDGIVKSLGQKSDFEIINLGNNIPVTIKRMIKILENIIGKKSNANFDKRVPGDVTKTWASIKKAGEVLGWTPKINLEEGLESYVRWVRGL